MNEDDYTDNDLAELERIEDIDTLTRRIDYMLHKSDEMVFELNEYQEKIEEAQRALDILYSDRNE